MKKFLSMMLALVVVLSAMSLFAACDKTGNNEENDDKNDVTTVAGAATTTVAATTEAPAPSIPNGYKLYNGEGFTVAYPSTWENVGTEEMDMYRDAVSGDNFNVVSEEKTDIYDNMTLESFNTEYIPVYESIGMVVTNAKLEHKTVEGIKVLYLTFDVSVESVNMNMGQCSFTVGDKTYTVTVTQVTDKD